MSFRLCCKANDLTQLTELERDSQQLPWSETQLSECFNPYYEVWADNDFHCYGVIRVVFEQAELINIAVNPLCRRSGIASRLLQHLHNRCLNLGAMQILLEVRSSNVAAQKLYEKFGYEIISTRKNYYKTVDAQEDGLLMSLSISV